MSKVKLTRNRIKELRYVKASDLIPNEKNWRTHSDFQSKSLRAVLKQIGIADAAIARETSAGLELLDGHLRRDILAGQTIPVLIVDLDDAEADILLSTLDPLAAMADADRAKLADLLQSIETDDDDLTELLESISPDCFRTKEYQFESELPDKPYLFMLLKMNDIETAIQVRDTLLDIEGVELEYNFER